MTGISCSHAKRVADCQMLDHVVSLRFFSMRLQCFSSSQCNHKVTVWVLHVITERGEMGKNTLACTNCNKIK